MQILLIIEADLSQVIKMRVVDLKKINWTPTKLTRRQWRGKVKRVSTLRASESCEKHLHSITIRIWHWKFCKWIHLTSNQLITCVTTFNCRILFGFIFACFVALEFALLYYLEEHYWLIPAFVIINIISSLFILKYLVLKSFLFSYSQSFIVNRELKGLNE